MTSTKAGRSTGAPATNAPIPRPRDRPRVLLAEDTETARALTSRLLERMGCDVNAVEHGEEAVQMARDISYDVIFLDLDMPLMDGSEAATAIRSLPLNGTTLIIAVSAFLGGIGAYADWRVFDDEIAKPISLDRLRQVILKAWPARSGELGPGLKSNEPVAASAPPQSGADQRTSPIKHDSASRPPTAARP